MKSATNSMVLGEWKYAGKGWGQEVFADASKYVGEIDGLRAVAILSVLAYHASGSLLGGGFVGVDVFFVISGYLITRILLSNMEEGKLSLAKFYSRRILRIAPALFSTLAFTGLVFFVVLPPVLSGDLLASLLSALFSYSNLWFYSTVDYFGNNSANPVLHTWSLAVEEQFYIFFPLFLFLISRAGAGAPKWTIFGGLALVSLVASSAVVGENQAGAFYFPWLRAWELLVGSMLAAFGAERVPASIRGVLSNLGLVLIVAACVLFNERMVFPGYSAMLPCLGAAAIIAGTGTSSLANSLLRTRLMRGVGQISYSLYLVHWPLVCLAALLMSLRSTKVQVAVWLASFVLAWLSWRFIETPFRRLAGRVPASRVFAVFAACSATLVAGFFLLQSMSSALWQRHPEALRYSEFLKSDLSFFRPGTCFLSPKHETLENFSFGECLTPSNDKPNVLVIGDSHAANIVGALAALHPSVNVLQATSAGCRSTLDTPGPVHCGLLDMVYRDWLPISGGKVEYVVLAARWESGDIEPLKRTISHLAALGKKVILYGPTPEYFVSVPLILAYEQIGSMDFRGRFLKQERHRLDEKLRAEFSSRIAYFSPIDNLCSPAGCSLVENGTPVFFDRDHLTPAGARRALEGLPLP